MRPNEIFRRIKDIHYDVVDKSSVHRWRQNFKAGKENVQDDEPIRYCTTERGLTLPKILTKHYTKVLLGSKGSSSIKSRSSVPSFEPKKFLGRGRSGNNEELKKEITNFLNELTIEHYDAGTQIIVKCLNCHNIYVET